MKVVSQNQLDNHDLSIVIVNYNTGTLLEECVSSILKHRGDLSIELFIVDNNSNDGSDTFITAFPDIHFIKNSDNRGFACANNQALELATGRCILLLNPDTVVFENTLQKLVSFLDAHPDVGAVSPRAYLDEACEIEISTLKIPTPWNCIVTLTPVRYLFNRSKELERIWTLDFGLWTAKETAYEAEGIGGAYFMLRRETMNKIGLLDERLYMGYEDTDWSLKIQQAGLKIVILTDTRMVHYYGQSKKKVSRSRLPIHRWRRGLLPFLKIHYHPLAVMCFTIIRSGFDLVRKLSTWFQKDGNATSQGSSTSGVILQWDSTPETTWIIEISNSPTFYDKFGITVKGNCYNVSAQICGQIAAGVYWWRVYPVEDIRPFEPHNTGLFVI